MITRGGFTSLYLPRCQISSSQDTNKHASNLYEILLVAFHLCSQFCKFAPKGPHY